jgi:HSP20 family protein
MAETVSIRRTSSILEEMREMEDRIMRRAHDIFSGNGIFGRDLENWLQAELELVWKPMVELCEKGDEFRLEAAVPGVDPKNIDIEVTPEDILLRAEDAHEHKEEKGTVHICEFDSGKMFRSIHLPKRINPNRVKAEFKNGILYLTADIAEEARVKTVKVEAA